MKRVMGDIELATELRKLNGADPEADHVVADQLLLQVLKDLGYHESVAAFKQFKKWYA